MINIEKFREDMKMSKKLSEKIDKYETISGVTLIISIIILLTLIIINEV